MSSRKTTLIRCSTTDTNTFFDSTLYEDLTLPADAEIALNSLTVESESVDTLVINNTNNLITWGIQQGQTFTATLTPSTYTIDNFGDFLNDINRNMNALIPFTLSKSFYNGLQWKASVSQTGVTNIQYSKTPVDDVINNSNIVSNNLTITNGDIVITDPSKVGYYFNKVETCKGFGSNYFVVDNITSPTNTVGPVPPVNPNPAPTEISIGLTLNDPANITTFSDSEITRGIKITTDPTSQYLVYNEIDAGNVAAIVVGAGNDPLYVEAGDVVYVAIVADNVKLMIGRNNAIEYEKDYPIGNYADLSQWNVFIANTLATNANRKIAKKKTCYDPFLVQNVKVAHNIHTDENELGANYPVYNNGKTLFNVLTFSGIDIANYLGYKQLSYGPFVSVYNSLLKTNGYSFLSDDKIQYYYVPESLVIEMMNIDLNSYDTQVNKRKSILAIVPNYAEEINSLKRFVYDVINPKYISIRNDKPRTLRNIQMRILDDDLTPITIKGKATISLFIR